MDISVWYKSNSSSEISYGESKIESCEVSGVIVHLKFLYLIINNILKCVTNFKDVKLFGFRAIWWNVLGIGALLLLCAYAGLVVFAYYDIHGCDPIKMKVKIKLHYLHTVQKNYKLIQSNSSEQDFIF